MDEQESDGSDAASRRRRVADERDATAGRREALARLREQQADEREAMLRRAVDGSPHATVDALAGDADDLARNESDRAADSARSVLADESESDHGATDDWASDKREFVADDRQARADRREASADERERLADLREEQLNVIGSQIFADLPDDLVEEAAERARAALHRAEAAVERHAADARRETSDRSRPLAVELVGISRALSRSGTIDEALDHVLMSAQRVAMACDSVSYSARDGDDFTTRASTGSLATEVDDLQYASDEGPCLDAIRTGRPVVTDELRRDDRWARLIALLPDATASSVMSTPVGDSEPERSPVGSLNHYSVAPQAFDQDDVDSAMLISAQLAAMLSIARSFESMGRAVETRDVIGQAKGILMERQGLTADEAFDVLRRASQRLNRKLRDVAGEIALARERRVGGPT